MAARKSSSRRIDEVRFPLAGLGAAKNWCQPIIPNMLGELGLSPVAVDGCAVEHVDELGVSIAKAFSDHLLAFARRGFRCTDASLRRRFKGDKRVAKSMCSMCKSFKRRSTGALTRTTRLELFAHHALLQDKLSAPHKRTGPLAECTLAQARQYDSENYVMSDHVGALCPIAPY